MKKKGEGERKKMGEGEREKIEKKNEVKKSEKEKRGGKVMRICRRRRKKVQGNAGKKYR